MKRGDAEEAQAWLLLSGLPELGDRRCQLLVERFGSAQAALDADRSRWAGLVGERVAGAARVTPEIRGWAGGQWRTLQKWGGRLLISTERDYPVLVRQIARPPALLFGLGIEDMDLNVACVAIVGPRHASQYGRDVARKLAQGLAEVGICVVSGMAAGVDTAAHLGALEAGGTTMAVLGCGADVVYPAGNVRLHQQIRERGMVLSEFPMGTKPEPGSFPRRNRLISGLSLGVVVVEAPAKSGSLITAACATEQSREVFAVPGSVLAGRNTGCHRLLRDGAKLVEEVDDILNELKQWGVGRERVEVEVEAPVPELPDCQRRVFERLGGEPRHVDELAQEVDLPAAELLGVLLELELSGLVAQRPGKQFTRAGR